MPDDKRETLPVAAPRWDGDCVHCAAFGIPPGMTGHCERCGQTVCAGHSTAHAKQCVEPDATTRERASDA